ncbi:MAG: heme A synthase [Bdellovibrionota bacterium]
MTDRKADAIRSFGNVVAWAAFLAFDLIVLGALVRATDSGLACPDWPLCYNQLTPVMDMQIFLEWFHRLSALILGGVLVIALVKIFRNSFIRKTFGLQLLCVGALFLIQCILGGLTVLKLLDPKMVSLHLINALVFFALLLWVAIKAWLISSGASIKLKASKKVKVSFAIFSLLLFVQIFVGGMVSSNYAGLVCPDFPKCYDQWIPVNGSFLIYLQVFHRFFAYFIMIYAIFVNILILRGPTSRFFSVVVRLLPTLVLLQILLGVINIFYSLPVWASVAHLANALALFTVVLSATILMFAAKSYKGLDQFSAEGEPFSNVTPIKPAVPSR